MVYVEIINNKPTRSTEFQQVGKTYKNYITTEYDDYTPINAKYLYDVETNSIILNSNYNRFIETRKILNRIKEIELMLDELDRQSQRAVRALICNTGTTEDIQYLQSIENKASVLREELRQLTGKE